MSESPVPPSYGELAALVAAQAEQLTEQATLMEAMRVELAALRRQVERDSSNSSQPPSQNGPGAKAKARAEKRAQQEGIGEQAGPRRGRVDGSGRDEGEEAEAGWPARASG